SGGPWSSTTSRATNTGAVALDLQVASPIAGRYTVTLTGRATGLSATADMVLTAVSATPAGAAPGLSTAMRVSGIGYQAGETVEITSFPSGLFPAGTSTADADGAINFATSISSTAAAGQYAIHAQG